MASVKFLMLLAVICACNGLGHGGWITTPEPVTIDVPKRSQASVTPVNEELPVPKVVAVDSDPTLEKKTTTPQTTTSSTTTAPPSPSPDPTPAPTTTTPAPTTTTPVPPTTTPVPPTTTPVPTTKPTPAPTTPPTPTPKPSPPGPVPPPDQGMWSYTDNNNVTCVVVQFAAQLNISYFTDSNNTIEKYVIFDFPTNANATNGSCNATEQWIELSWPSKNESSYSNTLTLVFAANETTKTYEMKGVNITLNPDMLVNASVTGDISLWHGKGWETPIASSYRCMQATYLKLTSNTNVAGIVTVTRLQEEAFRKTSSRGFSAARDCAGDVPDAVPIAVGCALGGLVVVVLVAYLLARRRSAVRGYLSM
ncbi:lysosome-associated membrane glycoprotein 1 [Amyelois transitella]|uniref:lysosome-associated membrane glycoprotein 1 n=1 Tax=Amyelois transitella TaxID=680683 RepID=UPI00067B1FA5|nr:lysosome-associated membrane glycoprotein 1 [Amyelois transitella]